MNFRTINYFSHAVSRFVQEYGLLKNSNKLHEITYCLQAVCLSYDTKINNYLAAVKNQWK